MTDWTLLWTNAVATTSCQSILDRSSDIIPWEERGWPRRLAEFDLGARVSIETWLKTRDLLRTFIGAYSFSQNPHIFHFHDYGRKSHCPKNLKDVFSFNCLVDALKDIWWWYDVRKCVFLGAPETFHCLRELLAMFLARCIERIHLRRRNYCTLIANPFENSTKSSTILIRHMHLHSHSLGWNTLFVYLYVYVYIYICMSVYTRVKLFEMFSNACGTLLAKHIISPYQISTKCFVRNSQGLYLQQNPKECRQMLMKVLLWQTVLFVVANKKINKNPTIPS